MARGCRLKSKQKNQVSHGTTHIRAACIAHVLNTLRNVVRSGGGDLGKRKFLPSERGKTA